MRKNRVVTPYQFKLDLGEGADCHDAYQEYLQYFNYEDNNERWVAFTVAWNQFNKIVAMSERNGQTLQ